MATKSQAVNFGEFISKLAQEANVANADTLASLQKKLQEEKQAEVERRLRALFLTMQDKVRRLREIRKMEAQTLTEIKELEVRGNAIVSGEDEEDTGSAYYTPAVKRVRRAD